MEIVKDLFLSPLGIILILSFIVSPIIENFAKQKNISLHLVRAIELPIYYAIIVADDVVGLFKGHIDNISLVIDVIATIFWVIMEFYEIREYLREAK